MAKKVSPENKKLADLLAQLKSSGYSVEGQSKQKEDGRLVSKQSKLTDAALRKLADGKLDGFDAWVSWPRSF